MRLKVPQRQTKQTNMFRAIFTFALALVFAVEGSNCANAYYGVPDALVGGAAAASSNYLLYGPNYYRYFYKELHEKQLAEAEKERKKQEQDGALADGESTDDEQSEDANETTGTKKGAKKDAKKEIKLPNENEEQQIIKANSTNMPEAVFSVKKQTAESIQNGFTNPELLLVGEPINNDKTKNNSTSDGATIVGSNSKSTNNASDSVDSGAGSSVGNAANKNESINADKTRYERALFCEGGDYNDAEPPILIASSDSDFSKKGSLPLGQNQKSNTQKPIIIDGKNVDNSDAFTTTLASSPNNTNDAVGKQALQSKSPVTVNKENVVSNGRYASKTLYIQNNSGKEVPKYLIPDGFDVKSE